MRKRRLQNIRPFNFPLTPFLFLLTSFLVAACGPQRGQLRIRGEFQNLPQADLLLYSPDGGLMSIDTLHIVKGRFDYKTRVPHGEQFTYVIIYPNYMTLSFLARGGQDVRIRGDALSLGKEVVEGADSVIPPAPHLGKSPLKVGGRLPKNDVVPAHKGKYLLINFWAEWKNGGSSVTYQTRQALSEHRDSLHVFTYSLDVDPMQERLPKSIEDSTRWDYHCDHLGWASPLLSRLGIRNIPYHILLDPRGRIRAMGGDFNRDIRPEMTKIGDKSVNSR